MHICIWHGYHLRGSGSNVYVRNIAAEAVKAGHRVSLFCQEDDPLSFPFIERAYDLDDTNSVLIPLGGKVEPGEPSCTVYRPNLAGHLPVYVYDKYERFPRVTEMPDLDDSEIEDYIRQNVSALRTVFPDTSPDLVITNHAVLSPEITSRALGDTVRRVSILHGSALNYSVKNDPRLHLLAVSGLKEAASVVVVSDGSGEKAREILGGDLPELDNQLKVVPCGVDTSLFKCMPAEEAIRLLQRALSAESGLAAGREIGPASADELVTKADALRGTYNERLPDEKAFDKIMELDPARPGLLVYTGKLIVSKGVQALLLALPGLFARTDARLLVVGFGTHREGLTLLLHALARGDGEALWKIAEFGRRLEGGEEAPLPEMTSFLGSLEKTGRLDTYLEAARTCGLSERVRFTGILEHDALCRVHALADLAVVPSIFPEAFGMVGLEAMACGALPVMSRQGGLADLIDQLREELGDEIEGAISIDPSPERMVQSILQALQAALELVRRRPVLRDDLSRIATERFGWGSVTEQLLATDTTSRET